MLYGIIGKTTRCMTTTILWHHTMTTVNVWRHKAKLQPGNVWHHGKRLLRHEPLILWELTFEVDIPTSYFHISVSLYPLWAFGCLEVRILKRVEWDFDSPANLSCTALDCCGVRACSSLLADSAGILMAARPTIIASLCTRVMRLSHNHPTTA